MRPHRALTLLFFATLAACEKPPPPPGAWERIDLWELEPRVEGAPEWAGWRRQLGHLGSGDVRPPIRGPHPQLSPLPAPHVRAVDQRHDARLVWRLEVGEEAYVEFVPLGIAQGECNCSYRVTVRDGAGERELGRVEAAPIADPAPMRVRLELGDEPRATGVSGLIRGWSRGLVPVDLIFDIEADEPSEAPPPRLFWGSPAVYSRAPRPPREPREGRPNVLFLGADTLRADALGAYGRTPSPTPALDRLAAESDLWLEAFSTFNVTNPSFASIFTGLYGKNHGVHSISTPLPEAHTTLAELFDAAGYATLAVIAVEHLGHRTSGLGQGFDEVVESEHQLAAEMVVETAMEWLAEAQEPFFAWLHFFDHHNPHTPPQPYAVGFSAPPVGLGPVEAWWPHRQPGPRDYVTPYRCAHPHLYLAEVAYLDRQIDRLLAFLESRSLFEETIVVFVADHGENLGEHDILADHYGLWDTTTHVPMMIRWPGAEREGRRLPGLVQTHDLFPTLLAAAGLDVPEQDGEDLRRLTGDGRAGHRAVFSEHANRRGASVRTPTHRFFTISGHRSIPDGAYLYDLAADPAETVDVSADDPERARSLARTLERWLADRRDGLEPPEPVELDEGELERLRALGYVE